jgi:proline iminopeptidase
MKNSVVLPLVALLCCGAMRAQEGSIPRDGLTLYFRAEGSGKPIVFLSGGPGLEVDYMKAAAEVFPREYQRVFLEQRGTGRSRPAKLAAEQMTLRLMVEDLEALRGRLKLDRLLLSGHSWGGMLAMAYAAAHPDRINQMILMDPGGPTLEFSRWFADNIEARLHAEDREARQYWNEAPKQGMDPDRAALGGLRAIAPAYFFDRAKALAFAAAIPSTWGTGYTSATARTRLPSRLTGRLQPARAAGIQTRA